MPSANTTVAIDGLTAAVTGLATSFNGIAAALQIGLLFELSLLIGIMSIAFWRLDKDPLDAMILFIVSGIITILIGVQWIDAYPGVSVALWALGVYQLLKAVLLALESKGPSIGISQFKGLFHKVRGG